MTDFRCPECGARVYVGESFGSVRIGARCGKCIRFAKVLRDAVPDARHCAQCARPRIEP